MRARTPVTVLIAGTLACGCGGASHRDAGVLLLDAATGRRERISSVPGTPAWSRDGARLYVSSDVRLTDPATQTLEVFDARGHRLARRTVRTADVAAGGIAVSPDGRRTAYVGPSRDAREVNTGELIVDAGARLSRVRGTPAWSPDGTRLAVERWDAASARADPGSVEHPRTTVLDAATGRVLRTLDGGAPSWLSDGRLLVQDGATLVLAGRAVLHAARTDWDVSRDARRLAVGGGAVRLVDLSRGTVTRLGDQRVGDVAFSPDATHLAAIAGDRVIVLDTTGATPPRTLARIRDRSLGNVAWSPDGAHLVLTAQVPRHGD
jgi:Tol biopolymer transport system component